ncbi:MAG: carboxypeptidase regulatory-like domain-containing protein [Planctomycetota bacterium]
MKLQKQNGPISNRNRINRNWLSVAALGFMTLAMFMIQGCNGCSEKGAVSDSTKPATTETVKDEPAPAKGDKPMPDPATLGELKGIVKFAGAVPPRVKVALTTECRKGAIAEIEREDVIVNSNGTLKNVFVYIKKGDAITGLAFPVPEAPVVLDQAGCQYVPHVFGIQTGQQLQIKNSDNATHNVNMPGGKNQGINTAQPANSPPIIVKLKKPETKVLLKCDMHPWMSAFANIVPHPFFFVTGDSGEFTIKNVPPGKYTVEAIHEIYGAKTVEVEVAPKATASTEFTYK